MQDNESAARGASRDPHRDRQIRTRLSPIKGQGVLIFCSLAHEETDLFQALRGTASCTMAAGSVGAREVETGIALARSAYPGTLASRLTRARNGCFVGRDAEQALWRSALTSESPAFAVLWLHGPGGIGKSALLRCLASIAVELGVAPVSLDAREMPTCDQPFRALLSKALGVGEGADPVPALHAGGRRALLIDTAEILGPMEDWLREEFLPSIPLDCLVVFASRQPPRAAWRADAGWAELLRVVSLRNLSPSDAQRLLLARNVPEARMAALLAATHGHPLALSLVADLILQGSDEELASPASSPDILQALLERFAHHAPDDAHRNALHLAAHARITDEALLRNLVEPERASELFAWLGSLSFVEQSAPRARATGARSQRGTPSGSWRMLDAAGPKPPAPWNIG